MTAEKTTRRPTAASAADRKAALLASIPDLFAAEKAAMAGLARVDHDSKTPEFKAWVRAEKRLYNAIRRINPDGVVAAGGSLYVYEDGTGEFLAYPLRSIPGLG